MPDLVKGILYLLVVLSILVIVHEWGHFFVAKLFKMRVEEFSLFFGPPLIRLGKRGDTEYNIRSIPAGGFVRIAGMEPDDISGGRPILESIRSPQFVEPHAVDDLVEQLDSDTMAGIEASNVSTGIRKMIQDAVGPRGQLTPEGVAELQAKLVSPSITTDEYKLIDMVLQANERATDPGLYSHKPIFQRALVIFAGPFMSLFFGYLLICAMGMTVGLPTGDSTNQVQEVRQDGPAREAGIRIGDRIVAINDVPTPNGKTMVDKIHGSIGIPLRLTINRGGQTLYVIVAPKPMDVVNEKGAKETVGAIGIVPNFTLERSGPVRSVVAGTNYTIAYVQQLVKVLFSRQAKDNVGGPIAMGQMATVAQRLGPAHLIMMAASFSLCLGIMNLLPIPILDGGHLLLLGIEKVRRRKLSPREVYRAQMVGLGVLAVIVCLVTFNDIHRWLIGHALQ